MSSKFNYICLFSLFLSAHSFAEVNKSEFTDLEGRVSSLELDNLLKRFNFSGNILNQAENINVKNDDQEANDKTSYSMTPFFMRAALNIDVKVRKNVYFYGTLGMSKFWNHSGREAQEVGNGKQYSSLKGGYQLNDSGVNFDTAYLNYQLTPSFSLALGRMSTNNGPPIEQLDGQRRYGTYPRFAYNSIFDGIALSYNFNNLLKLKDSSLKTRFFYTPFSYVDENDRIKPQQDDSSKKNINANQTQLALLTEFELKDALYAKKLKLYHIAIFYENFYDIEYQDDSDNDIEYDKGALNSIYFELESIADTGLNASYTYYTFQEDFDGSIETSFNYLVNMNYEFANSFNANHILGFEYINTDEIFYLEDHNSLYLNNFYTRQSNNGYHLYYTVPVSSSDTLRFGVFNYKGGTSDWAEDYNVTEVQSFYTRWKVYF